MKNKKEYKLSQENEDLVFEGVISSENHTVKQVPSSPMQKPSYGNPLLIPLSIILAGVFIAGAVIYNGRTNISSTNATVKAASQGTQAAPTQDVAVANYPSLGSNNAPVTVVEASDFECPFCKQAFTQNEGSSGPLTQLVNSGKVKLIYRNFPLSFHKNAHMEAEAGYCAVDQGKFWQLHDFIFSNTTSNGTGMTEDQMVKFFSDNGWDASAFKNCIDSGKYKAKVDSDITDGTKYGVTGTPTFFIGKKVDNGVLKNAQAIVGTVPFSVINDVVTQLAK